MVSDPVRIVEDGHNLATKSSILFVCNSLTQTRVTEKTLFITLSQLHHTFLNGMNMNTIISKS